MSTQIKAILGREILDSRGNPTLEVDVEVNSGWYRASVPSGASTGSHEALELRDKDPKRFNGKGVQICIQNIEKTIFPQLENKSFKTGKDLDQFLLELDGTENKSMLGANTTLALSMAFHRACAALNQQTLFEYLHEHYFPNREMIPPVPMMNVINGGQHADNPIQIQEFMICPHLNEQEATIHDRIRAGAEIYQALKTILSQKKLSTNVGDEGGFAPNISSDKAVLTSIANAITQAGYSDKDVSLALDVASTEFFENNKYKIDAKKDPLNAEELTKYYSSLFNQFRIASIEDPFAEDDWEGWQNFTKHCSKSYPDLMIVGDDLLVTNPKRLEKAIGTQSCNTILIKLNQIGTVLETTQTMNMAFQADYRAIVSHRSGETEDPFIAHLVTASGAGWIKTGAPCRTDRNSKYNELLRIFIKNPY
jgi:enolase